VVEDNELVESVWMELADVMIYTLGMANQLDIDLGEAVRKKMDENKTRFDEETAEEISAQLDQWK
jgi:NTP pyrophosphatase (non-canonical NTP hydrolase)